MKITPKYTSTAEIILLLHQKSFNTLPPLVVFSAPADSPSASLGRPCARRASRPLSGWRRCGSDRSCRRHGAIGGELATAAPCGWLRLTPAAALPPFSRSGLAPFQKGDRSDLFPIDNWKSALGGDTKHKAPVVGIAGLPDGRYKGPAHAQNDSPNSVGGADAVASGGAK